MPYSYIIISGIGFIISCLWMLNPSIQNYDQLAVLWASQYRTTFLDEIAVTLSTLGGLITVLLICGIYCVRLLRSKSYHQVAFICLAIFGSSAIGWGLKSLIQRPRPNVVEAMVQSYGASFPSAHSIYSIVIAYVLLFIFQKQTHSKVILILIGLWPVCMGLSRIYLGVHYPTDVLAGWSVGLMWIALLQCAFNKFVYLKTNNFLDKI